MVVSTIYDEELKSKVFQVRDSERYTNSTHTSLEISYQNNRRDYITVDMTATVNSHLGKSYVSFYDGDTMLGSVPCNQGTSTVTFTTKVPYGYHKFYAKYTGNMECLSSKSGILEYTITEPNLPHSNISLTVQDIDSSGWIDSLSNTSTILSLKTDEGTEISDRTVELYANNLSVGTVQTGSSTTDITSELAAIPSGTINLKAVFEGDNEYLGDETEITIYAGYNMVTTPKYAKIGVGDKAIFNVSLSKPDGTPVPNKSIILRGDK